MCARCCGASRPLWRSYLGVVLGPPMVAACTTDLFRALADVKYIVDQPGPRVRTSRLRRPSVPIKQRPNIGAPTSERGFAGRARRLAGRRSRPHRSGWSHPKVFVLKVSGDQIIRTPAAANVNLGSDGAYQITVGVERVQKAGLGGAGIRLNSP
jgi:hypothetical protein